jgi:hypothetical protein
MNTIGASDRPARSPAYRPRRYRPASAATPRAAVRRKAGGANDIENARSAIRMARRDDRQQPKRAP